MTPPLSKTPVADGIDVFTLGGETIETGWGVNATAVYGDGAVLLVDPFIAPAHARLLEAAIRERTDDPVRFVVLTHHHSDHALGSSWFASKGAIIAAHRICRDRMAAEHPGLIAQRRKDPELSNLFSDAEPVLPDLVYDESVAIDLGPIRVQVRHMGHGHTPGDAILLIREEVVVCGDLVSNGYHVNCDDADPDGYERALRELRALPARVFVPGHGAPCGRELVDRQLEWLAAVKGDAATEGVHAAEAIRAKYPDYLLAFVLESAVTRFASRRG